MTNGGCLKHSLLVTSSPKKYCCVFLDVFFASEVDRSKTVELRKEPVSHKSKEDLGSKGEVPVYHLRCVL